MEDWIAALKTVQNREHFEVKEKNSPPSRCPLLNILPSESLPRADCTFWNSPSQHVPCQSRLPLGPRHHPLPWERAPSPLFPAILARLPFRLPRSGCQGLTPSWLSFSPPSRRSTAWTTSQGCTTGTPAHTRGPPTATCAARRCLGSRRTACPVKVRMPRCPDGGGGPA